MKRISEIIGELPVEAVQGDISTLIREIQYDSRKVSKEDIFIAIRGFQQDGHQYIQTAYEKGCRAFIVENMPPIEDAVIVQVKDTRRWLPFFARNYYENVANELKNVGITGTNGKTTTAYLLFSILKEAGWKPGLLSTVEYIIGEQHLPSVRTTPESLDLHRTFYEMYRHGLKSVVLEVSSHALALHRTAGIHFLSAVFTNLGHDHLDFHKTKEKYFLSKKKLFDGLHENDRAVINIDDPYSQRILKDTEGDVFSYSMKDPSATICLKSYQMLAEGMSVTLKVPSGEMFCTTSLVGKFNIYNVMAATATALSMGLLEEHVIPGIESVTYIPGRCERFLSSAGFRVYIDYAHSPEALQRMLEVLLEFKPPRLTVVFGCGGDRDVKKRPWMGKIAEDYADKIFLTNDNPRTEDPLKIIEQIQGGIYDKSKVQVFPDRREAIETALKQARKNEIVLIAGKGHETYQEFAHGKIHFDDREVVRKILTPAVKSTSGSA
jgi:UDP-N-acetylmuramoyl-L-alanyl-D-glutamate--2,6-diaminopimelate ligase